MRYKAILFDLDGTLVNSIPDLAYAVNAMLEELGYSPMSEQQTSLFLGKGMEHLLLKSLQQVGASTDLQTATDLFKKHYLWRTQHSIATVFDGVIEGLDAFQTAGCQLAVVTNKPMAFVPELLEQMGLAPYFELLVGGDSCEHKKPHPQPFLYATEQLGVTPSEALVIGDSMNDSMAARAAGMDVLIVPYGYNEGQSVHSLDCDGIVSTITGAAQWAAKRN